LRFKADMRVRFRRAALPKDKHALVTFDHKVFRKADWFSPDDWDQFESYWMIVDEERVGCCAFARNTDFDEGPGKSSAKSLGSLYIASTGILPDHQAKGLGERFKRWQIAWARRYGFTRIVTNSRRSNQPIIRLNRKCGFSILYTTARNYYQRPSEPAVVMELKLMTPISHSLQAGRPQGSDGVISSASMQTDQIVALLVAERNRLDTAIHALQGSMKPRGRAPKASAPAPANPAPSTGKREISTAARKAMADAAKKRWAEIKAGKAPNPFAKAKRKKTAKG